MYAVVSTGGKQYKVAEGEVCRVEKLDAAAGAAVELDKVLMIADDGNINIGTPYVEGGKVTAVVSIQPQRRSSNRSPRSWPPLSCMNVVRLEEKALR